MKTKKIPYYIGLGLLTLGASVILGFLSFGGMYALAPLLPLALGAFALSVGYEGEIYLQNIKGALNKLFKRNYLQQQLAQDFLTTHFPDTKAKGCPQFFKDYEAQLRLLDKFNHHDLKKVSEKQKKQVEDKLHIMEKWFALQLFAPKKAKKGEKPTSYAPELQRWLKEKEKDEDKFSRKEQYRQLLAKRQHGFRAVKTFSILAGVFMGLGTTYLLMEGFAALSFLASISAFWPMLILPMAVVAGAAYGLLTYNAITDLIANDTIRKWYHKLRANFAEVKDIRSAIRPVLMAFAALVLVGLAITLTICTAGTWWTVVKNSQPLFSWMTKIPGFVMGIINPIITGISALVFNIENTAETFELIDNATKSDNKKNIFSAALEKVKETWDELRKRENLFQIFNPVRLLLRLILLPLRIIFFLGHLLSIGVTGDRVPGLSQIASAFFCAVVEGLEDGHYFFGHGHDHEEHGEHGHSHNKADVKTLLEERFKEQGHDHSLDLPTKILVLIFTPLYFLAATWDYFASKLNPVTQEENSQTRKTSGKEKLQFSKAWDKHFMRAWEQRKSEDESKLVKIKDKTKQPSADWQREQSLYHIDKMKAKLTKSTFDPEITVNKIKRLETLETDLKALNLKKLGEAAEATIATTITMAARDKILKQPRLFSKAKTSERLAAVNERTAIAATV